VGNRGYSAVRVQIAADLNQNGRRDRVLDHESRNLADQLTGASNKLNAAEERRYLAELAKRSYDVEIHVRACDVALRQRLNDSAGRNWKNGYRAMAVFDFLARAGSEVALAKMWDNLPSIFQQTRFSAQVCARCVHVG
jgi:hypothetical protein